MMRFIVALLLVSRLFASPALAGDADLPKPDPKGHWRKLTMDDATSTSKCLGSREMPLCAVETAIACSFRANLELCQRAWGPKKRAGTPSPRITGEKYRIISSGYFKKGDRRQDDRGDQLDWVDGDVWIVIDERECDKFGCSKPSPSAWRYLLDRYIVHKGDNGWRVVQMGPLHWRQ